MDDLILTELEAEALIQAASVECPVELISGFSARLPDTPGNKWAREAILASRKFNDRF